MDGRLHLTRKAPNDRIDLQAFCASLVLIQVSPRRVYGLTSSILCVLAVL